MLSLSRRIGEAIIIGNDIVVKPLTIRGNRVQLSIQAPRRIQISRSRTCQHIKAANKNTKHFSEGKEGQ